MTKQFFLAIFMGFICINTWAQKPRFAPQIHEVSLQLVNVNHVPAFDSYYKDSPALSLNIANGVMYKYHISLSDAIRLGASWRKGEFGVLESIDRFSTYEATKRDLDFRLGYERKYNMGVVQLFGGLQGIIGRGDIEDIGELEQTGDPYKGKYFYTNYGGSIFAGLRLFFSTNISMFIEGEAYYLQTRRQLAPENTFYLFSDNETGLNANAGIAFHLVKMKKRCTCPVHRR